MKQELVTLYEFSELDDGAKERATNYYINNCYDSNTTREIFDSLQALLNLAGVTFKEFNYGHLYLDFPDNMRELSGGRAMAWLENNLLSSLRIPYKGKERWKLSRYGSEYRAGKIRPCPFTGMCFDADFLDALIKDVKEGHNLADCFTRLGNTLQTLIDSAEQWETSAEYITEYYNGTLFLSNGDIYAY